MLYVVYNLFFLLLNSDASFLGMPVKGQSYILLLPGRRHKSSRIFRFTFFNEDN